MHLIIRFCLLMLSMTGYFLFLSKNEKLHFAFAPAATCAMISGLMFVAGLLNFLPEMALLIFIGGYLLFVLQIKNKCRPEKRKLLMYFIFLFVLIYFSWLVKGAHFLRYDNFSHWATVVKNTLLTNRMPNFNDPLIMFQAYPMGSTLFIYYICKIIGITDACIIWAQTYMNISFVFCMAAFIRRKNWYCSLLVVLFGIYSFCANIKIYDLCVDTLLPLAAVATASIILFYRNSPRKAVFWSSIFFVLLMNIKNSGIFFYFICFCELMFFTRNYIKKHKLEFIYASIGIPCLTSFFWKKHVALVFPAGASSKHAMSMDYYKTIVFAKSKEDILEIGQNLLEQLFKVNCKVTYTMLMIIVLLVSVMAFKTLKKQYVRDGIRRLTGICIVIFVLYMISLYGMYIFSMPLNETNVQGDYERYMMTVVIFIYGIVVLYFVQSANKTEKEIIVTLVVMLCLLYGGRDNFSTLYKKQEYTGSDRYQLQEIIRENNLTADSSYFIYRKEDDYGYLFFMTRYEMWTPNISVSWGEQFNELKGQLKNFDYLIIWETDEYIDQYLKEHDLQQYQKKNKVVIAL